MENRLPAAAAIALTLLAGAATVVAQSVQVGTIDFYGLHDVSERQAREALTVKEGDTLPISDDSQPPSFRESARRLSMLPGVVNARLELVCCDGGHGIVYVGIEAKGARIPKFRPPPEGRVRLSAEVLQAGSDFSRAAMAAVRRGDAAEDTTKGHSLMHDPTARAIQERFVEYARDLGPLRDVLRHSAEADQRALAAQVLGYAADKRDVVDDLVYGMTDSSEAVRNNATRALAVMAGATSEVALRIPPEPFIDLINSPVWTDRNKASLALMALTERRNTAILATLRRQAIVPLVEMARWKSEGHALPAFMVLGRIAGQSDQDVHAAWRSGQREAVIDAALKRR